MRKLSLGKILTHMLLLFIVIVWILPTFGLLISSLRDKDQVALTGWWTALKYNEFNEIVRTAKSDKQVKSGKLFIIEGNLLGEGSRKKILYFGTTSKAPSQFKAPSKIIMKNGSNFELKENGDYLWSSETEFKHKKGKRSFLTAKVPPRLTLENYKEVIVFAGVGQAFLNSITVAIPSTVIPLIIGVFPA